jgi:acyl-CoA thioester hydrolase
LTPPLGDFIEIKERVRYSEVDQMGVAHNKNYFEWFEIGRTEFCRQKNISYKEIEARGFYLVVAEAFCRYKKPLRYDEQFLIRVSLKEMTPKKAVFSYEILTMSEKKLVAAGYTVHIVTNSKAEVSALPDDILNKIKIKQP